MASITGGVPLGGFISPTDSADTFAVTNPTYGLGGLRNVGSTAARDAIPTNRREQGMLVFVEDESKYYSLSGGITNGSWTIFISGSGGGVTGPTGATGNTGADSTVVGPKGNTGNTGADSTVIGPTGAQGPAGAGSGGSTLSSGAGLTLTSNVAGVGYTMSIDPTAVIHVAGVSSDGGATFGGVVNGGTFASLIHNNDIQLDRSTNMIMLRPAGSNGKLSITSIEFQTNVALNNFNGGVVRTAKGISMDAAGITFPDGTHQTTAASGSGGATGATGATGPAGSGGGGVSAGAGMTLDGSTLGIDPTAVIHVAGISSDGGITAGGDVRSNKFVDLSFGNNDGMAINSNNNISFITGNTTRANITSAGIVSQAKLEASTFVEAGTYVHAGTGVSLDAGGITFADGTHQTSAASGSGGATGNTGAAGSDGTSVGYTAGNTAPSGSATGDFWYENDTALYYANVWDGSTLGWLQISGIDGVTGNTGPAGSGGGGGGVSAGAGLTLNGSTLGIDPTAVIHVAGISADGGATFDGNIYANRFYGSDNINTGMVLDAGFRDLYLKSNDVTCMHMWYSRVDVELPLTANLLVNTKAGISMDTAGITFPDGTHQTTAGGAGGTAYVAGDGLALSGPTFSIDPTAIVHVAGISSDGGITLADGKHIIWSPSGAAIENYSSGRDNKIVMTDTDWGTISFKPDNNERMKITKQYGVVVRQDKLTAEDGFVSDLVVQAKTGISMDAGGITFADGTFQSTAPTGSTITAGAGMTLAGSTLGIDPAATIHVAGISADGATFGRINTPVIYDSIVPNSRFGYTTNPYTFNVFTGNNDVRLSVWSSGVQVGGTGFLKSGSYVYAPTYVHAGTGVSLDAGGITFPDGTYQDTASSGSGVTGATGATGADSTVIGPTGNTGADSTVVGPTGNTGADSTVIGPTGNTGAVGSSGTGIQGPTGNTGPAGSGGGGVSAGAGMTLDGSTLGIDPTATIHVAGISGDGGITAGGDLTVNGVSTFNDTVNIAAGKNIVVNLNSKLVSASNGNGIKFNPTSVEIIPASSASNSTLFSSTGVVFNKQINTKAGISMDIAGITFPDGTYQTTAAGGSSTVTASYSGHLESAITKTYYLDPRVPTGRTVTEFYAICGTGGCSAGIAGQNGSISSINVSTSGVTGSLANTTLPVGGTLDLTLSNVISCFDLRFAVRYTQ